MIDPERWHDFAADMADANATGLINSWVLLVGIKR
jgi:hypothetical protein